MPVKDLPRPDGDFAAYMNNYFEGVKAWFDAQGLDPSQYAALTEALTAWNGAYPEHVAAQAAARAAKKEKDQARQRLESAARPLTRFIQAYPGTTDADRAMIGITIRDPHRTAPTPPRTRPTAQIEARGRLTHTLKVTDESTPTRRARPRNTIGAEVWVALVDPQSPAPTDPSLFTYLTTAPRPTVTTQFRQEDGGKTAVYLLRWANTRGERGAWSDPHTATVAA